MTQLYDQFFKRNGVRSPQFLVAPMTPAIEKFSFPQNSLHHFIINDGVTNGPSNDEFLYRDIAKKIMMEHVAALATLEGSPKKVGVALTPYIRQYHNNHKRYRLLDNITQWRDPNTLCVVNYALVSRSYRYTRSFYAEYYKWRNIQTTLWERVGQIANSTERNQFIFVAAPKILPSKSRLDFASSTINEVPKVVEGTESLSEPEDIYTLELGAEGFVDGHQGSALSIASELNIATEDLSQNNLRLFNTPELLWLLEMWTWLGETTRQSSILNKLKPEQLKRVNLVYEESGHFVLINLGLLNSWRFVEGETDPHQKEKIKPDQLQKRFLRLMMDVVALRADTVPVIEDTPENTGTEPQENDGSEDDENKTRDVTTVQINLPNSNTEIAEVVTRKIDVTDVNSDSDVGYDDSRAARSKKVLETLDDDLHQLEVLEKQNDQDIASNKDTVEAKIEKGASAEINPHAIASNTTPTEVLHTKVDDMGEEGILTVMAYKKLKKTIEDSLLVKAPGEDVPLHSFVKIQSEDVKIKESHSIPDIKTVIDKTMLKSSLHDFDNHYITNVLKKDTAGMVVNAQRGGFVVTKYEVEKVETVLGAYEQHSVRINPIEGVPSTLMFRLPALEEDGTYTANGVKYRLRKQRGDMPIRKIAPDRVALTSYYGKTFVARSSKKVNNYSSWICAQVMAKGLDIHDDTITDLNPNDVFDNEFKCPRLYSTLAMSFRSFSVGGFALNFDHRKRAELYGEDAIKNYEIDDRIIFGKKDEGVYLLLDDNGLIYTAGVNGEQGAGTLESFLKIDTLAAPVDYAEIKVFGKDIPVGVYLSYLIGFNKLIELLKVIPRRVAAGQRQNLQDDEYAIVFSDETLIFNRDDRLASMILAGFSAVDKVTRNFSSHTFDKRGVYLNLFEGLGATARYLREVELMDAMFIDPITKELLEEMKEPVVMRGLIVRAAQMLLTDDHPDALDMNYMRIKGYERFSGAVYAELVQAVREHRAKGGRATQPIQLHPYAVWKRIAQDPSVGLVKDINPIENLKQAEAVTFAGTGGRGRRSMVKSTRAYHPTDMGVISESTVDSSDVAVNTYLSADPQFNSVRGTTNRYVIGQTGPTALISTSALLSVASDRDD